MNTEHVILTQHYPSPCGDLILGSYEDRLCLCNWVIEKHQGRVDKRLQNLLNADYKEGKSDIIQEAARQLDEYFKRERTTFDIPILFTGTDFQKKVWHKLLEIPYGQTLSYGEMAKRLDIPNAVRAVANANGANAISIFVPCHRVIGSDRSLTGYGGGLTAKKYLLEMESIATALITPIFPHHVTHPYRVKREQRGRGICITLFPLSKVLSLLSLPCPVVLRGTLH